MDAPNDVRKYNSRDAAKQRRAERRFRNHLKKEPPSRSFMETPTSKQKAIAVNHLANHLQQEARAAKPSADGTHVGRLTMQNVQHQHLLAAWDGCQTN
jgi:hypothetical protein